MEQANSFPGLNMDKALLKCSEMSLPLFTSAEASHLHRQFSDLMAAFPLSNKQFQNLHSRDDDWYHYFAEAKRETSGAPAISPAKPGCFQKEQIFHLHPFLSVSQVVGCVRVHTAQKWRGKILKHELGFAKSIDISSPLSRVKALYTTSQMTISKAHPIPWITTIPILFWWTTPHQRSQTEPPSSASPWKNTSRSSARDMGVSRVWGYPSWVILIAQQALALSTPLLKSDSGQHR